nr:DUF501 domain-containing protein [Micromonospora sp. DSM 115978]
MTVPPPDRPVQSTDGPDRSGVDVPESPAAAGVPPPVRQLATEGDLAAVAAQLGRPPRGTRAVAHRCPCGRPDVVETTPRLADGTPFPTLFYLTCPRAVGGCSRLESAGLMRQMADRLATDPELAAAYRAAHEDYLGRRDAIEPVPEIAGVSAGGMPGRVKCLHVHVGHALATGPGVNPFGDEALRLLPPWWTGGPCVPEGGPDRGAEPAAGPGAEPAA